MPNNNSIIIGGIRKDNNQYFNSLYYITQKNSVFFDKKKLVPFGEFLPLRDHLSFLDSSVGNTDITGGKKDRLINTL